MLNSKTNRSNRIIYGDHFWEHKIDSDYACEEALLKMNENPFRIILSY